MKKAAVLCAVILSVVTASAQSALPGFDVVSVRPNRSGNVNSTSARLTGNRYTATNATLVQLLRVAYGLQEFQIDAPQGWAGVDRFDVAATIPEGSKSSDWPLMLQSLLRDRFKLTFHLEPRPAPAYLLTVARDGHKLPPADPAKCTNPSGSCGLNGSPTHIDGMSVSTAQLAARLSRSIGVMVIDKTGLDGLFDIRLEWTLEDQFIGRGASASPTIFPAIRDQLGLQLDSARAPVDVLVVDSAERPSPD